MVSDSNQSNDEAAPVPSSDLKAEVSEVTFRFATVGDIPELQEMLEPFVAARKLLRRTPEEFMILIRHGFVAEVDGKIVGFAAIEIYSRKLAEIQSLAVSEGFQGRGIGRQLVRMCLDRARELDVMEVLAITSSEEFLRGCGFDYSLPDQKKAMFCQLRPRGH